MEVNRNIVVEGQLVCTSPLIPFQKFLSIFLELKVHSRTNIESDISANHQDTTIYIALVGNRVSSSFASSCKIGHCYSFDGLKTTAPSSSSSSSSSPTSSLSSNWYNALDDCIISNLSVDSSAESSESHSMKISNITNLRFIQPACTFQLQDFSSKFYSMCGYIRKLYPEGWLEIETLNQGRRVCQFSVVLTQYQVTEVNKHTIPGALVSISWMLPLYLWGKLRGFATTIRSRLTIGRVSSCESDSLSTGSIECKLKIPPDLMNRCRMYSLWRFLLHRFMKTVVCNDFRIDPSFEELVAHSLLNKEVIYTAGQCAPLLTLCANKQATITCALSAPSIREEFMHPWRHRLHMSSARFDTQWLSSQLPKMYSVSKSITKGLTTCNTMQQDMTIPLLSPIQVNSANTNTSSSNNCRGSGSINIWCSALYDRPIHDSCSSLDQGEEIIVGQVFDLELAWCAQLGYYCVACLLKDSTLVKRFSNFNHANEKGVPDQGSIVLLFNLESESEQLRKLQDVKKLLKSSKVGASGADKSVVVCLIKRPIFLLERGPQSVSYQRVPVISVQCASDVQIQYTRRRTKFIEQLCNASIEDTLDDKNVAVAMTDASMQILSWIQNVFADVSENRPTPHNVTSRQHGLGLESGFSAESIVQTECLSVRQLLVRIPKNNMLRGIVVGVIIFKSVETDSNQFGCVKRQRQDQQCRLILRDVVAPDVVTLYIEISTQVSALLLGAIVVLRDCMFSVSGSNKFVYLKAVAGVTQVGILGILPLDQLRVISSHFSSENSGINHQLSCLQKRIYPYIRIKAKDGLPTVHDTFNMFTSPSSDLGRRSDGLFSIPTISLRALNDTRFSNRCVWQMLGNIVFIKTIGCYLRCINCLAPITTSTDGFTTAGGLSTSQYACMRCHSHITVRPYWQAQLVFDDGTTECLVHAEDNIVIQLLQTLPPSRRSQSSNPDTVDPWLTQAISRVPVPSSLSDMISTLEAACCQFGKVEYNYFTQLRYRRKYFSMPKDSVGDNPSPNPNSGDAETDVVDRDEENPKPSVLMREEQNIPTELVNAEEALVCYINSRSVNVLVQVIGKLLFQKPSPGTSGSSNLLDPSINTIGPTEIVNVRLQVDNTNAPWQTNFVSVKTLAQSRLTMDALFLQALHRHEDITLQTELLLAQLT